MSERDEFYRRFSRSYDKLHQSEKQDDLVERVAAVFWETPGKPDDRLRAAIAVLRPALRAEALEEAASPQFLRPLVEEQAKGEWDDKTIDEDVEMFSAAIRALIPKEEV